VQCLARNIINGRTAEVGAGVETAGGAEVTAEIDGGVEALIEVSAEA
jgi:hypothetical protein